MQNVLEFDMHIYTQYLLLTHLHPKVNITNTFTSKGEDRCYFQLRVNSLVPDYHTTHLSHKCPTHLSHKCPTHFSHECPIPISHYVLTSHFIYVWNFEHWCASSVCTPPLDTQLHWWWDWSWSWGTWRDWDEGYCAGWEHWYQGEQCLSTADFTSHENDCRNL